jgi:hypothetical protein
MVPLSTLAGTDLPMRILGASALIGSPFVCAGLVFSSAFAKVAQPEKALGINILGALLGGCLEYLSVVIGTRDLVLIALALYVISLIAAYLIKPGTSSSGPQIESRA